MTRSKAVSLPSLHEIIQVRIILVYLDKYNQKGQDTTIHSQMFQPRVYGMAAPCPVNSQAIREQELP